MNFKEFFNYKLTCPICSNSLILRVNNTSCITHNNKYLYIHKYNFSFLTKKHKDFIYLEFDIDNNDVILYIKDINYNSYKFPLKQDVLQRSIFATKSICNINKKCVKCSYHYVYYFNNVFNLDNQQQNINFSISAEKIDFDKCEVINLSDKTFIKFNNSMIELPYNDNMALQKKKAETLISFI